MKNILYILILGAGVIACSFRKQTIQVVRLENTPVISSGQINKIDSLVSPYKLAIDQEMNQIVTIAEVDFIKKRPNGNLGNLIADLLLSSGQKYIKDSLPVICLLNHGGLRATINKGPVKLGDIFKVLPFDNQLVLVKMPAQSLTLLKTYLKQSGGEPLAGIRFQGEHVLTASFQPFPQTDFYIVTSDYLVNGGDKMTFFEQRIETIETGVLLRDAVLQEISTIKTLVDKQDLRIQF